MVYISTPFDSWCIIKSLISAELQNITNISIEMQLWGSHQSPVTVLNTKHRSNISVWRANKKYDGLKLVRSFEELVWHEQNNLLFGQIDSALLISVNVKLTGLMQINNACAAQEGESFRIYSIYKIYSHVYVACMYVYRLEWYGMHLELRTLRYRVTNNSHIHARVWWCLLAVDDGFRSIDLEFCAFDFIYYSRFSVVSLTMLLVDVSKRHLCKNMYFSIPM